MTTEKHIAPEVLLDYLEERSDAETAARVQAHLDSGCARCAEELASWRRLLGSLQADQGSEPPEEVLQRAIELFDTITPERPWWEKLLGTLKFDSRAQPAEVGARQVSTASFHLLFAAGGVEIDLLCEREESGWRMTGQALSPGTPRAAWAVLARGAGNGATWADTHGEFCLTGLASGVYELTLRGANCEIVLPNVHLSESLR